LEIGNSYAGEDLPKTNITQKATQVLSCDSAIGLHFFQNTTCVKIAMNQNFLFVSKPEPF